MTKLRASHNRSRATAAEAPGSGVLRSLRRFMLVRKAIYALLLVLCVAMAFQTPRANLRQAVKSIAVKKVPTTSNASVPVSLTASDQAIKNIVLNSQTSQP
jgi:hypothetical protein